MDCLGKASMGGAKAKLKLSLFMRVVPRCTAATRLPGKVQLTLILTTLLSVDFEETLKIGLLVNLATFSRRQIQRFKGV